MRTFLLKQLEQLPKDAVAKVTPLSQKSSTLIYKVLTVAIAATVSVAYAEQPLSDSELDTKFIEVKVKPICTTESADKSTEKAKSEDIKNTKKSCHDANNFVAIVTNKEGVIDTTTAQKDSANASLLLAGVLDNIRLLGGTDVLGVPAGVAITGVPLMFGSENYSYKWAGNLNQIFQPTIYELIAPYSVYDSSSLGYGFREEAHFPQNIPQPTIQVSNPRN